MKIKHLRFKIFAISTGVALFLLTTAFIANNIINNNSSKPVHYYQAEHEYLNSLRKNPATGTVSYADYAKASREVQAYREKQGMSKSSNYKWDHVGPDNLAGRIRSVLRVELNGTPYWYAGSISGGLWRVEEGKNVWRVVESASDLNVSCMHLAADGSIYVGTGEAYYSEEFNLLPGFRGRGIYKSTNGETFTQIATTVPDSEATDTEEWFYVNKIATANNRVFAGTNTGLKVSNNMQGGSWTLAKTSDGNELDGECTEVTSINNSVAAFVGDFVYISIDGNPNNFECVSTMYYDENKEIVNPTMLPRDSIARVSLAFAPSNPDYLYAVAIQRYDSKTTTRGTLKNIYRSVKGNDGWSDWQVIGPGGSTHMFYVFESNGFYSLALTVDPNNENLIYVGGNDLWRGSFVNENVGFYQWTQLTTYASLYSYAYVPSNHFSYLVDGNGNLAIGSETGVYTFNTTTGRATAFNLHLNTSQFYSVSVDLYKNFYGGTQGNGTVGIFPKSSISGKSGYNLHPSVSALIGENYYFRNTGGYIHNSLIYPPGTIMSINGKNTDDKINLALIRYDNEVPQNISWWYYNSSTVIQPIVDSCTYITPSLLWESFNYTLNKDSVDFVADTIYKKGSVITAHSKNASYPFKVTLDKNLAEGETIRLQDPIASRFFIGIKGSILMTTEASNFSFDFHYDDAWFTISSNKFDGITGTPQCLALSKDANYLYVGTAEGKLYLLSNIAYAYDAKTANIGSGIYPSSGTLAINPYCVVATTLLHTFDNRTITSLTVDPENPERVVVTLGNYGCDDYIYLFENTITSNIKHRKVDFPHNVPVYTSLFVEGVEGNNNQVMVGTDFGIWTTNNISAANAEWTEEDSGIGNVPVFMLKQQNVQTVNDEPVLYDSTYITNYRAIYAATFGSGLFECNTLVKSGNDVAGIEKYVDNKNSIVIYPNPAKDFVNISIETELNESLTLNIYNISGQLVKTMSKYSSDNKTTFRVSTSSLQQGTYIAKIHGPNCKPQTSKFIVVK